MWLVLVGLFATYYVLRYLWELIPLSNLSKRAVFITGADTGFGRLLTVKCAKNGIPTFAGCLTKDGIASLKEEAPHVHAVLLDVRSDESVKAAAQFVKRELRPYGIRCSILEPGSFKTGIITAENVKQRIERHWQNLSDELKEEYGEKYKDRLIRDLYEKWATTATDNLDDVVGSYYHAITARWPRNRYRCGWDTTLIRIPMTFLPTELEDLCMRLLLGSDNVPAVLEKGKEKKD